MELTNLIQSMPTDQPRIRVYNTYIKFNPAAVRLLELQDGDYVCFTRPRFSSSDRVHVFVGKTTSINGSFRTIRQKNCMRVNSRALVESLWENLDGPGCYRIAPEDSVTNEKGEKQYNIFFRKYEKKDTD